MLQQEVVFSAQRTEFESHDAHAAAVVAALLFLLRLPFPLLVLSLLPSLLLRNRFARRRNGATGSPGPDQPRPRLQQQRRPLRVLPHPAP